MMLQTVIPKVNRTAARGSDETDVRMYVDVTTSNAMCGRFKKNLSGDFFFLCVENHLGVN